MEARAEALGCAASPIATRGVLADVFPLVEAALDATALTAGARRDGPGDADGFPRDAQLDVALRRAIGAALDRRVGATAHRTVPPARTGARRGPFATAPTVSPPLARGVRPMRLDGGPSRGGRTGRGAADVSGDHAPGPQSTRDPFGRWQTVLAANRRERRRRVGARRAAATPSTASGSPSRPPGPSPSRTRQAFVP